MTCRTCAPFCDFVILMVMMVMMVMMMMMMTMTMTMMMMMMMRMRMTMMMMMMMMNLNKNGTEPPTHVYNGKLIDFHIIPLLGSNISPPNGTFEGDVHFPKVGYGLVPRRVFGNQGYSDRRFMTTSPTSNLLLQPYLYHSHP